MERVAEMNVFLVAIGNDPETGSRQTLVHHEDVLQIGMKVERRGLEEGALRVVGIDASKSIVALHHEGYTAYIGRAYGSKYSQAALSIHKYELIQDYQSSGERRKVVGVHLMKCLMEAPITR
jgi:hypothetical protein